MYYPIFVDLKDKICVVVGGGRVAQRKVSTLLKYGAKVKVVSPMVTKSLQALICKGKLVYYKRQFRISDLREAFLVIGSTGNRKINSAISNYARQNNILSNIVDSPEESTFIVPSHIKRGELVIAISTGGIAPSLAKKIRKEISVMYGREYAKLLQLLKQKRQSLKKEVKSSFVRRRLFEQTLHESIPAHTHRF